MNVQVSDDFQSHLPVSLRKDYRLISLLQERQRQRRLIIQVNRKASLDGRKSNHVQWFLILQKR